MRTTSTKGRTVAGKRAKTARRRKLTPAKTLADVGARVFVDGAEAAAEFVSGHAQPDVRTKFVVIEREDVPVVIGADLVTRHHVKLAAVYEAEPVHHGLGTIQGHRDNRVFGLGRPEAAIAMVFESKAVADVFMAGRGFAVDFTAV